MAMRNVFFALAFVLSVTGLARAVVTGVQSVQVDKSVLSDFVTNDILIDFDTDAGLGWHQVVLELTQGSIWQLPAAQGGQNVPPLDFVVGGNAEAAFDTFVTLGGRLASEVPALLEVGGAVDIVPGSDKKFDDVGINITWAPGTGVVVPSETDFLAARITLSDDAIGTMRYIGTVLDTGASWLEDEASIMNGIISFEPVGEDPPVIDPLPGDPIEAIIGQMVSLTVDADQDIDGWELELLSGDPANPATITPSSSADFEWDTTGSAPGLYSWKILATNANGTGEATLSVNLAVPEPSSIALAGLMLLGLVGYARRK